MSMRHMLHINKSFTIIIILFVSISPAEASPYLPVEVRLHLGKLLFSAENLKLVPTHPSALHNTTEQTSVKSKQKEPSPKYFLKRKHWVTIYFQQTQKSTILLCLSCLFLFISMNWRYMFTEY